MPELPTQKELAVARGGLVIGFFLFFFATISAYSSGASLLIVLALGIVTGLCLWAAVFAGEKIAVALGQWFP